MRHVSRFLWDQHVFDKQSKADRVTHGSRLTCDPIPDLTCDPILNPPKVASLTTLFPASLATLFLGTNAKS